MYIYTYTYICIYIYIYTYTYTYQDLYLIQASHQSFHLAAHCLLVALLRAACYCLLRCFAVRALTVCFADVLLVVPLTLLLAACLPALQCVGGVLCRCFAAGCPVCVAACIACFASCLVACIDFIIARLLACVVLPVVWRGVLPVCWQKQQHSSMRYRGFYFWGVRLRVSDLVFCRACSNVWRK